jgi:hypothetical protein
MKKVLILDVESCADCPCCHQDQEHEWWCIAHTDGPKRIKGDLFDVTLESCPLKPLPERMTDGFEKMFMRGWNACLEELNK